jgi:hypothetical protein
MLDDISDSAHAHVAAALAVLAGTAASDAISGLRLGRYARGQDHQQAIQLLESVDPIDRNLPGRFRRLLSAKNQAHYSPHLMTASDARALIHLARSIVDVADTLRSGTGDNRSGRG